MDGGNRGFSVTWKRLIWCRDYSFPSTDGADKFNNTIERIEWSSETKDKNTKNRKEILPKLSNLLNDCLIYYFKSTLSNLKDTI